jgi:hypothetical protein
MGTVNLCSGVKRLELEPNHSPMSRAAVKNECSYKSDPPFTFVAWRVTALFSQIKNEHIKEIMGVKEKPDIVDIIERKRLQRYGHVKRMQEERLPKLTLR